jgi:glycosyltransferase involved in cell wall biosynthesis
MSAIVVDFERLKNPNTGLYSFSKDLGKELLVQKNELELTFFIPKAEQNLFGDVSKLIYNPIHKIIKPRVNAVWHLTHQGSKFGGKKNILTIHDLNFLVEKKNNLSKIKENLKIIQNNIIRSQQLVCISNYTAMQVQEYLDIKDKPIDVIYNGCSLEVFTDFDQPKYRPQQQFLFSIGTVFRKKNFHVLSNLLCGNDYELVFAGILSDKTYVDEILNYAKKLNVLDRVHLVGAVTDSEKFWYYNNCSAFLFPSIAEGFGLPVVEAMSLGKPVLLSKLNSLPEVGGDLAFYFESFEPDAMQDCLQKASCFFGNTNHQNKSVLWSKKFSWQKSAQEYIELYKKLF